MPPLDKLACALAWAARGFKVFPIASGTKDQPMVAFTIEATNDIAQITKWWRDDLTGIIREHNIGVLTTGHAVVDIDVKNSRAGLQSFADLGGSFDALTVRTPSGGFHVYTLPPYEVANSQGTEATGVAPGLDVRGFNGYVLAPGSEVDGKPYELWIDMPVPFTPDAILAHCKHPGTRDPHVNGVAVVELDTTAAVASATDYVCQVRGAPQGDRSGACYRLACQLKDRGISEPVALDLIIEHWIERCTPPFEPGEATATVAHAFQYSQNLNGHKSAEVDFAHVIGNIEVPPALRETAKPNGVWEWGNTIPMHLLQPRPWIIERILLRGEVTALIAPGGIGKSQLTLTIAILLALGLGEVFGLTNRVGRAKSLIYNAEDSRNEMSARLYATCIQMGVDPAEVEPHITLVSGKEIRLKLVTAGERGKPELNKPMVKRLIDYASDPDCVMVGLDPLIALHDMEEGLATGMRYVLDTLVMVAEQASVGVVLAIHTPKAGALGAHHYVGSAEAGRGSVTIRDTCRIVLTLAPPKPDDADRNDLSPDDMQRLLRLDDAKMNYQLLNGQPLWLRKHTVVLPTGDPVGAFMPFDMETAGAVNRRELVSKMAAAMTDACSGEATFAEAVAFLCDYDPIYGQIDPNVLKGRVERHIGSGTQTEAGYIAVTREGGKRFITVK